MEATIVRINTLLNEWHKRSTNEIINDILNMIKIKQYAGNSRYIVDLSNKINPRKPIIRILYEQKQ